MAAQAALSRISRWIGHQDNNVAEYVALLEALQCALFLKAKALHVYSDSQVVVRQMRGEYICRSSRLYSLHWTCRKLARTLSFSISHVPREDNAEANRLANTAVREREWVLSVGCQARSGCVCAREPKTYDLRPKDLRPKLVS